MQIGAATFRSENRRLIERYKYDTENSGRLEIRGVAVLFGRGYEKG